MRTIVKNNTAAVLRIEDLGLTSAVGSEIDMFDLGYSRTEIDSSGDLRDLVSSGEIIVNNGDIDLGAADGLDLLSLRSVYQDDEETVQAGLPIGGSVDQVLVKTSSADHDAAWVSVNGGVMVNSPLLVPIGIQTESKRWQTLFTWNFPGTTALNGTPTKLDILYKVDRVELNGLFRVRYNRQLVAGIYNLQALNWTLVTDSALGNLTAEASVWDIQIRTAAEYAGYCLSLNSMTLRFD